MVRFFGSGSSVDGRLHRKLLLKSDTEMKIETALRYAAEITRRLESVNGLIPTPRGGSEFYLVKKAWVFGSTIKGSDVPNDLDVLLFAENAGARQTWQIVGFDPVYYKAHRLRRTRRTDNEALMWLRKGMKMVSLHDTEGDETIFDKKVEIYPRFLLTRKSPDLTA